MKYLYALLLIVTLALSACKKDAVSTDYDKSYAALQAFKKTSDNSYSYIVYNGSVFGSHAESKIIVQKGKVMGRSFVSGHYDPGSTSLIVNTTWEESGSTLNTHEGGFEALTLDQVYARAKTQWLNVSKKDNDIYFEASNNGIISSAGYVPKGCQDDCFTGVHLKEVTVYVKEIK
jgi:hypothetical protein